MIRCSARKGGYANTLCETMEDLAQRKSSNGGTQALRSHFMQDAGTGRFVGLKITVHKKRNRVVLNYCPFCGGKLRDNGLLNPDREALGKLVREVWVQWAKGLENPKPSWLVPWEGLAEADKEVDRRIGEVLYRQGFTNSLQQEQFIKGTNYEHGLWSTRNLEALIEDQLGEQNDS